MPQIKLQNQMVNTIGNEQRRSITKQEPKPIDQYLQILIKQIKLKELPKIHGMQSLVVKLKVTSFFIFKSRYDTQA